MLDPSTAPEGYSFDKVVQLLKERAWFDIPIVVWCFTPLASSLSNGLGVYDGLSACLSEIVLWGIPYYLGRVYRDLGDARHTAQQFSQTIKTHPAYRFGYIAEGRGWHERTMRLIDSGAPMDDPGIVDALAAAVAARTAGAAEGGNAPAPVGACPPSPWRRRGRTAPARRRPA